VSVKHLLAEKQDSHDEFILIGPNNAHQIEELERDLSAVRHHYYELGQRASALASERDAAHAKLGEAKADVETARRKLNEVLAERDQLAVEINARLQLQQAELDEERCRRQELEAKLAQADTRIDGLLEHYERQHRARDDALAAELDALSQQLAVAEQEKSALEAAQQALAEELATAQRGFATEHDSDRERIAALEQRRADIEAEGAKALQYRHTLEAELTDLCERHQRAEQHIDKLEKKLQAQHQALEAELGRTRTALAEAQRDNGNAAREQSRLSDALFRLEAQLDETENLNQTDREASTNRIAAAESAQQTLSAKIDLLVGQLQEQQERQAGLEQQIRDERKRDTRVRSELKQKSVQVHTILDRLHGELEKYRATAYPTEGQQTNGPVTGHGYSSSHSNSWKMTAGVSLLVGTVASAAAYWNVPKTGQKKLVNDKNIQSPAESRTATTLFDVLGTTYAAAWSPLAIPPASPFPAIDQQGPRQQRIPTASSGKESEYSETPEARTSSAFVNGQAAKAAALDDNTGQLQTTARESLRAFNARLGEDNPLLKSDLSILEQQHDLLALGFDLGETRADGVKGRRTRQALYEFQLYYLPVTGLEEITDDGLLASIINVFAEVARNDQEAFGIDKEVLAAIRLGNLRTGMDFPYLMELAYTESSFDPEKKARKSSATGLYQFTDTTWLQSVKAHGDKYGLGMYAAQIEQMTDDNGRRRPIVYNPLVHQHILGLRYNPRISTLLAAEFALENKKQLSRHLGGEFGRTELYLTHFFGIEDALEFLRRFKENPQQIAAGLFPVAAESNPGVFNSPEDKPRTVAEVYRFFQNKFDTGRYDKHNPGLVRLQGIRRVEREAGKETNVMRDSTPAPSS
jgi:peptidoglycan hydrolase-like protein with peptidoglycan-binding domain